MKCSVSDLRCKDVVSIHDGTRLGTVSDVEVDTCTSRLVALVIYGRAKFFGLFGREDDCVICWDDIELIGEDTILVRCSKQRPSARHCGFVDSLLGYAK